MVDYYIYAKDFSGSTENDEFYHSNGMKTFKQFKSDVERIKQELLIDGKSSTESKIIYLHWGDKCYEVDEERTVQTYIERKSGRTGTDPKSIIEWIKKNYDICGEDNRIKLLYIITDGYTYSTERCFELNENMQYETVVFHAINKYLSEVDISVAASFFKRRCLVYLNHELLDNVDISEEFDYDKITVDNFSAEKKNLKSYVWLKFIRKFKQNAKALQEIDNLKKLRDRLLEDLSSKAQKIKVNLETKNRKAFLLRFVRTNWYKSLNARSIEDAKRIIEQSISTLINYIVSDKTPYAFVALKFYTKFGNFVEEKPIVDVNFTAEQEIEFPNNILDEDKGIPVVILTEVSLLDKIIFQRTKESDKVSPASFSKFKSVMECPLFLMNDLDVSESIGYFYTLNVYKQLLKKTNRTEPRTRRPFHGGLVLTDTELFDEYNDYVLSATYFDSKKVNFNIGLFYFVLWKNCDSKKWMDGNVSRQFKKYVMRRISATVCKIGLSSLPLDPRENVSLPTALWYCVDLSSCIFKDDPRNFMHERLRMFYGVAHWMLEILKDLNYDVDLASFVKRRELIKYVMILKKIPKPKEKVYYLLTEIFKRVNGFLVSEIIKPYNLNKLNYLKLRHKDMLRDDVIEEKVNLNDYVHLMHYAGDMNKSKARKDTFIICKKTFRPFFTIEKNKSFYTELVNETRKMVINNPDDQNKINITYEPIDSLEFDRTLSLYNLFILCVEDSEKYPTLPEYMEYIVNKKKFTGNLVTIFPPNVYLDAEYVYLCYQSIVAKVNVSEFLKVTKSYVKRSERIKAEEVVKFNGDSEISEFISSEEIKVNLKKNIHISLRRKQHPT